MSMVAPVSLRTMRLSFPRHTALRGGALRQASGVTRAQTANASEPATRGASGNGSGCRAPGRAARAQPFDRLRHIATVGDRRVCRDDRRPANAPAFLANPYWLTGCHPLPPLAVQHGPGRTAGTPAP